MEVRKYLQLVLFSSLVLLSCNRDGSLDFPEEDGIPHIYIDVIGGLPIESKEEYLYADLIINGKGQYENLKTKTKVKLRGNTTMSFPKKPYKLKLEEKQSLFGLAPAREWVLLANFVDETFAKNAAAMKIGELVGFPFVNHIIPVDVTVNGVYIGNYMFTEQIELNSGRVEADELWELDIYYDEKYKFISDTYHLPFMVKGHDLDDFLNPLQRLEEMKAGIISMEKAVSEISNTNSEYTNYIDINTMSSYLLTYAITGNFEINHPKSIFMYKKSGKYFMGPIWDFDYAPFYREKLFESYECDLYGKDPAPELFFMKFFDSPEFVSLFRQKLEDFKLNKAEILYDYLRNYGRTIKESVKADNEKWREVYETSYPQYNDRYNLEENIEKLIDTIESQLNRIDPNDMML